MDEFAVMLQSRLPTIRENVENIHSPSDIWKIKQELKELNKLSESHYISSFSETPPNSLLEAYMQNRFRCHLSLQIHKQSYSYSVQIKFIECRFSSLVQFYGNHYSESDAHLVFLFLHSLPGDSQCLSINQTERAFKQLLKSTLGDDEVAKLYGRRTVLKKMKILALSSPKREIMDLFIDVISNQDTVGHSITRHPKWCFNNISLKCSIFGVVCHTSINCPYFVKCKKTATGCYVMG